MRNLPSNPRIAEVWGSVLHGPCENLRSGEEPPCKRNGIQGERSFFHLGDDEVASEESALQERVSGSPDEWRPRQNASVSMDTKIL